ncbi:hypothetical protein B6N60_02603 [Richelia sinica FACHB-800]|uniref:Colicin E3-like ribonuclease domain-containing protein n=1 Tax=Richelia sinica FACHB-800 TaxID=1357546 RepID=A0A975T9M1_9NOST|nr:colicin E3/pyocin S6 family cytotoxin [Richelia sinica]MBD2666292.1 hypothetical protein [Richelia sinica FACHB-800]QXE23906.1 hypothetical protein B6N60_02603 [Richelia sinica FACHB-800]
MSKKRQRHRQSCNTNPGNTTPASNSPPTKNSPPDSDKTFTRISTKKLPAFPNAVSTKPKTFVQGGGGKRKRWECKSFIYEEDTETGNVEKYRKSDKKHIGEFDPMTGEQTKPPNRKRKLKD